MGRVAQVSLVAVGFLMPGPVRALQAALLVGPRRVSSPWPKGACHDRSSTNPVTAGGLPPP
jgi:hypothetical protein